MPKVPVLREQEVALDPLRPVYQDGSAASLEAFGSNRGRDLINAGQAVTNVSAELSRRILIAQIEDNEKAARDLDNKLAERIRTTLFGDGTPENLGYYSLKGEDALAQQLPTQEQIRKYKQELAAGASNARVRDMFTTSADSRIQQTFTGIAAHSVKERLVALDITDKASILEAQQDAVAAANDPAARTRALVVISQRIQAMADRNGWSPEVQLSAQQEAQTAMLSASIGRLMLTDLEGAKALYAETKPLIDATAYTDIENGFLVEERRIETQARADAAEARRLQTEAEQNAFNGWVGKFLTDGPGAINLDELAADPNLRGRDALTIYNLIDAANGSAPTAAETSTATLSVMLDGIRKGTTTPDNILQAVIDGKLSRTDADWAIEQYNTSITAEGSRLTDVQDSFLAGTKGLITSSILGGLVDGIGDQKFYEFEQYMYDQVAAKREAGEDPYTLFQPGSADYLGRPEVIGMFQRSLEEQMNDAVSAITGNATAIRAPAVVTPAPTGDYTSAAEVQAAIDAKEITLTEGQELLQKLYDEGKIDAQGNPVE